MTGALSSVVTHADSDVYEVKPGDSLSGIALQLDVSLTSLLTVNRMTASSLIVPGQRLVVPAGASSDVPGGSAGGYTVRAGDTLGGIAARHRVSLTSLLTVNRMTASSLIVPGQRLVVPAGASSDVPGGSGGGYTVRAGDTLGGIAARHRVSLTSLLTVNRMTASSLIVPGQRLVVPAGASGDVPGGSGGGYTVRAGDTLGGIAARHRVSLTSLLTVNRMTASSLIVPGMKLTLPAGASVVSVPTGGPIDVVLDYAKAQLGKPYTFFTAGPDRFDCSGLTLAAYARIGISLVHHSAAQARQGTGVNFLHTAIRPGDLVFMDTNGDGIINHVGMAINATTLIQTPGPGDAVRLTPMPAKSGIVAVRRLVPSN